MRSFGLTTTSWCSRARARAGVAPDGSEDDRFFFAGTGARWNNDTTDIAFLFDDAGKDRTGNLRDWLILTPES